MLGLPAAATVLLIVAPRVGLWIVSIGGVAALAAVMIAFDRGGTGAGSSTFGASDSTSSDSGGGDSGGGDGSSC